MMRSVFGSKQTPPETAEDRALAQRFERRVRLSRLALLGERVWEALLWPFLVVAAFLVVSLLDLWSIAAAAAPSRSARRLRPRARSSPSCRSSACALPTRAGGAAAPGAHRRYQAPARVILRGSARHHAAKGDGAALGRASRASVQLIGEAEAVLARAPHRPQGPLCDPGGLAARRSSPPCSPPAAMASIGCAPPSRPAASSAPSLLRLDAWVTPPVYTGRRADRACRRQRDGRHRR